MSALQPTGHSYFEQKFSKKYQLLVCHQDMSTLTTSHKKAVNFPRTYLFLVTSLSTLETKILPMSRWRSWHYPEAGPTVLILSGHSLSTKIAFESLPNVLITSNWDTTLLARNAVKNWHTVAQRCVSNRLIYWAVYWLFYWHVSIMTHWCATGTTHF